MKTVGLLTISSVFMTSAWYGHLRHRSAAAPIVAGGPPLAHTTGMDAIPPDGEPPEPARPPRTPEGSDDAA